MQFRYVPLDARVKNLVWLAGGAQAVREGLEDRIVVADNGNTCTAKETRTFAQQLGLKPCFTPAASPQSNGMSPVFVKTLKREFIRAKTETA